MNTDCISKIGDLFSISSGLEYPSVRIILHKDLIWHPDNLKYFHIIDCLAIISYNQLQYKIYDEELLECIPLVRNLRIESVNISRIPNLFGCYLTHLSIYDCNIMTCAFPIDYTLIDLNMTLCKLTCIKSIENLKALDLLSLNRNDIACIRSLTGIDCSYINLSHNNIIDATPLKTCSRLKRVDLYDNPIVNVKSLIGIVEDILLDSNTLTILGDTHIDDMF